MQQRSEPLSLRARQREVERQLVENGLLPGAAHFPKPGSTTDVDTFLSRFAETCQALGPLFSSFGRYLATRADLFPARDGFALRQALPDRGPAAPIAEIKSCLEQELRGAERAFTRFEEEPCSVRLLHQSHRAQLADGRMVMVRATTRQREAEIDRDRETLPLLERVFRLRGHFKGRRAFAALIADFRHSLEAQLDAAGQAEALAALAKNADESQLVVVPQIHTTLSSRRVLTRDRLEGHPLDATTVPTLERRAACERMALVWLRQALTTSWFPMTSELLFLRDGRLAVTGGSFASLPVRARANLWTYLRATASHDPDKACRCLLNEVVAPLPKAQGRVDLRQLMRQSVPFRDGFWTPTAESLVENAVLHWRYLHQLGITPAPHLLAFYRALFEHATVAEELVPGSDALREALEDLEWQAGWAQLRQLIHPTQLGESLSRTFATLMDLPQQLDHILNLFAREGAPRLVIREPAKRRRFKNLTAGAVSLLLMVAAVVVLSTHPELSVRGGSWIEPLRTVLFVVLALIFFSSLGRKR